MLWTEITKSILLLKNIASKVNAMQIDDMARIGATRIHSNMAITLSKYRKRIHIHHTNSKSTALQWSYGDVQNVEMHGNYFDNVNFTVCHPKGFLFAETHSMCMSARYERCANHFHTTDKAICNHPFHSSLILDRFSARELDDI